MTSVVYDAPMVKEVSITVGAGDILLAGRASSKYQTFFDAVGTGIQVMAFILDANEAAWDFGRYTVALVGSDVYLTRTGGNDRCIASFHNLHSDTVPITLSTPAPGKYHTIQISASPGYATGDINFQTLQIINAIQKSNGILVKSHGSLTGPTTLTCNFTDGNVHTATSLGGAITITLTNPLVSGYQTIFELWLTNFGLGTYSFSNTITWVNPDDSETSSFTTYAANRGGASGLPSAATARLKLITIDGGVTYRGQWL